MPTVWFCRWAKPLVGIITWALQVWTWSAKKHVLVVVSPSPFFITVRFPVVESQDSPAIPVVWDQSRGSCKVTHNAGEAVCHLGFSCSLEELEAHWEPFCMVLCWPGAGQLGQHEATSITFWYHLSWSPWFKGMLQPHPCVLGFSVATCYWIAVSCSFAKGSEVKNDLCHDLHDVIPKRENCHCAGFVSWRSRGSSGP